MLAVNCVRLRLGIQSAGAWLTKQCHPALLMLFAATNINANELFRHADIGAGKKLVWQHCISCHASSYGGDGSEIYTREFRKITTASGLLTQVRYCSNVLNLTWFDDDELNAAAYLNKTYYLF